MKPLKLVIILFVFVVFSCKKEVKDTNFKIYQLNSSSVSTDTIKAIAKLIKTGVWDKIHIAQYEILEPMTEVIMVKGDTINVGYYNYKAPKHISGDTFLTLLKHDSCFGSKNYYIFPEYDGVTWSKQLETSFFDFENICY